MSQEKYMKKIKNIEDLQIQIQELSKQNELRNILKIRQRDESIAQL